MKKKMVLASLALVVFLTGCSISESIFDRNPQVDISKIEFVEYQTENVSLEIDEAFIQNSNFTFTDAKRKITYKANFSKKFDDYLTYLLGEELGDSRIFDGMSEFSLLTTERKTEVLELTNVNGDVLVYEVLFMTLKDREVAIVATNLHDGVLSIKASFNNKSQKSIVAAYLEEMLKTATPLQTAKKLQLQGEYVDMGGISLKIPNGFVESTRGIYASGNVGLGLNGITRFTSTNYDEAFIQLAIEFEMINFEVISASEKIFMYDDVREDGVELLGGLMKVKMPNGARALVNCIFAPEKELMITLTVLTTDGEIPITHLDELRNTMIFND